MKVLVTGGAGFIGSHIVKKLLSENCEVIIIDNLSTGLLENVPAGVKLYNFDICNDQLQSIFELEQFNSVVHLAAQTMVPISIEKPDLDCKANIMGTVNVLESCRKTGVKRVVFASSAAVYGDVSSLPILEDSNTAPQSFYGLSKLTVENYLQMYNSTFGLEYIVLRYANVYGERQGDSGEGGVISIFTRKVCQNERITVHGNGGQTRDFVYVGDVALANWIALTTTNANNIFNISTEGEVSVNDLINVLQNVSGKRIETNYGPPREGDIYRSVLANGKAFDKLGWQPKVPLQEGIRKTYKYFADKYK